MRLKSLRVTNYKCIFDSEEFSIADVTALVGKNESGKSAILQALYKLSPTDTADNQFSDIEEFPRSKYSEYEETRDTHPANVLTTKWELSDHEVAELAKVYGLGCLTSKEIIVTKGYDNIQRFTVPIDEGHILAHLKSALKLESDLKAAIDATTNLENFFKILEELSASNEHISEAYKAMIVHFPEKNARKGMVKTLAKFLPTFVYFADYHRLPGQVALDNLNAKIQENRTTFEDRVFLALLSLVGTTVTELHGLTTFEKYIAKLESVSSRLTREIFEYWTQNKHLEVDFRFDAGRSGDPVPFNTGHVFRTRIRNKRHGVTVSFDERSTGFVWFFSFLVYFSQIKKTHGEKLVILLDEPGLNLHAKAQADFLRYVNDKLAPNYQVIYTTHSPFLIDQEKIINARTVEDKIVDEEIFGTKVGEEILSIDKDTILPLQAALGYEITQTLFISPNTILVEGPSDLLYLKFFSNQLKIRKREYLDSRWAIAPCGGIDKISSFVILFNSQKLNIAVVTDFHKGDKKKVENLKASNILRAGNVFTINNYLAKDEADIEDLLGEKLYIGLVNSAYGLISPNQISGPSPGSRIVEFVETKFKLLPPETPEFDHYRPAEFLLANEASFLANADIEAALENFEALIRDLNKAIEKK